MSARIDPADVTVVVQGPRGPLTSDTIATVRRHLPGTRIVLSTWTGDPLDRGALEGAGVLAQRDGVDIEVVDLGARPR